MIVTFAGVVVAALAGVLGVWMERDREAPPKWAWVFSAIILVAMFIEMGHSIAQASEDAATEESMARVLEQLADIAASGDNPALEQFVGAELAIQARANPGVMNRLEKKVEAKGGDVTNLRKTAAASRRQAAGLPASRPGRAGATSRSKAGAAGKSGRSSKATGASAGPASRISGGVGGARSPASVGAGSKAGSKAATSSDAGSKSTDTVESRSTGSSSSRSSSSGSSSSRGKSGGSGRKTP
ncbi:MAG: hypothetical protein P8R54_03025 [Myxococcota bacterium]|nr:hypothetical protein [Myxococcota bacterium]